MTSAVRAHINQANAAQSTGPKTPEGKQRASLNAIQHGLTGNRVILQPHEHEAYTRLTAALTAELNPATEFQRQLVQKIIDCHTRLNRLAAMESNILNFGLIENHSDAAHDDATECMAAQTRAWLQHENSFEKLGRYEARLSRQLLAYTKELERLQSAAREAAAEQRQAAQNEEDERRLASFRKHMESVDARRPQPLRPEEPRLHSTPSADTPPFPAAA
jgi:hypothetical protein